MTLDQLGAFQREMLETVGQNNYKAWIEPLEFADIQDGVATFNVPTNFIGNYVSQNFGDLLIHKLTSLGETVQRVHFRVANSAAAPRVTSPSIETAAPVSETVRPSPHTRLESSKAELPGAPLDARFTFDSFVVGKPNELANAAARRVAEGGPVSFNPLFLYGGVGLGKTHLMHAIAWELQNRRPDLNVLYLSAEQFMYRFVQALRDRKMMDFQRAVPLRRRSNGRRCAVHRGQGLHPRRILPHVQRSSGSEQTDHHLCRPRSWRNQRHGRPHSLATAMWSWWWICIQPTMSCALASCKARSSNTVASTQIWCWPMACWNSSRIAFPPMCACLKAHLTRLFAFRLPRGSRNHDGIDAGLSV